MFVITIFNKIEFNFVDDVIITSQIVWDRRQFWSFEQQRCLQANCHSIRTESTLSMDWRISSSNSLQLKTLPCIWTLKFIMLKLCSRFSWQVPGDIGCKLVILRGRSVVAFICADNLSNTLTTRALVSSDSIHNVNHKLFSVWNDFMFKIG